MTLNDIYHAIDPVALSLGPLQIRWYGLAYVAGFICAFLVIAKLSQRWKIRIDDDAFFTVVFCVIFGVILGGRLGYVLVYGDGYYLQHPEKILAFNEGGMSFHGGLVGVIIGGIIAAKITKIPFLTLADMGVVGVPIGLFFGRCANFINGELWGAPTDMPWGVVFGGAAGTMPRHPSQLYEALLEGVVLFIILFALSRKTPARPRGTFFGTFLLLYGLFRFTIEFIRQPDAQIGYLLGTQWFTMGQALSIPLMVAGVVFLIYAWKTKKPQMGLPDSEISQP